MLNITVRRKQRVCLDLLNTTRAVIGLADVGAGGPLKRPWRLLPASHLSKFDFEPAGDGAATPLCVSNRIGRAEFFVARDERGSSFHRPLSAFAQRFGLSSHLTARTIEVECTTLDHYFDGRFE